MLKPLNIALPLLWLVSGCFEKPVANTVHPSSKSSTTYSSQSRDGDERSANETSGTASGDDIKASQGEISSEVMTTGTAKGGVGTNSTDSMTSLVPIKFPETNSLVFGPLGKTAGGYTKTASATFPNICERSGQVNTTGPLFPFNENQTIVMRGPLTVNQFAIFSKNAKGVWSKAGDLSALKFVENSYGTEKAVASPFAGGKVLENGREIYARLPVSGEILLVVNAKMPHPTDGVYSATAQDDVPAIWLLNSEIFQKPSAQYFCNCRGEGGNGGCGEVDIAEVIPGNKEQVTATLYSYEGARGGILPTTRPTADYQVYGLLLRSDGTNGQAWVMEANDFDFTASVIADSAVATDWLPKVKRLNKGSETLNPPSN